ncbi:MAG: hypothetical protein BRD25_00760 [Bacteroidetes bacterium QH_1_61_8]|nr:MAG: hypothetical protein BRD25_00760 [Bacteroidetes bacterium QH_1_61_8]
MRPTKNGWKQWARPQLTALEEPKTKALDCGHVFYNQGPARDGVNNGSTEQASASVTVRRGIQTDG